MANKDIKLLMAGAGIKQYEVASQYGLHESNFCKLLRTELKPEIKVKIMAIIKELEKKGER